MIIKEISKSKFEKRFPEKNKTYGFLCIVVYLENGVILLDSDWNGEGYIVDGKIYKPIYDWNIETDQGTVIGYEEMM